MLSVYTAAGTFDGDVVGWPTIFVFCTSFVAL